MSARMEDLYLLRDLALPRRTGRLSKEDLQAVKTIADWTRDFVAQPHPQVGRAGSVCPFVPPAIESARAWFARFHAGENSEVFLGHIRKLAEAMRKMGQEGTEQASAKTT